MMVPKREPWSLDGRGWSDRRGTLQRVALMASKLLHVHMEALVLLVESSSLTDQRVQPIDHEQQSMGRCPASLPNRALAALVARTKAAIMLEQRLVGLLQAAHTSCLIRGQQDLGCMSICKAQQRWVDPRCRYWSRHLLCSPALQQAQHKIHIFPPLKLL
jgi:hypothetical protein